MVHIIWIYNPVLAVLDQMADSSDFEGSGRLEIVELEYNFSLANFGNFRTLYQWCLKTEIINFSMFHFGLNRN